MKIPRLVLRTLGIGSLFLPFVAAASTGHSTSLSGRLPKYDPSYAVRMIPSNLLSGADAVIRRDETVFESNGPARGTLRKTFAATIFNDKGRDYGKLTLSYDTFRSIDDLEAVILDEEGQELSALDNDDIVDVAEFDGYSLYQDSRVQYVEMLHSNYPYTVIFTYEVDFTGILQWPTFLAQKSRSPVQLARFEMRVPSEQPFRWWCNTDSVRPAKSIDGSDSIFVWEFRNLPSLEKEEMWNDFEDLTVMVLTAPNEFELDGHRGGMANWKEFGSWMFSLWKGLDEIPPEAAADARSLVAGATDERSKVDRLYRYVQERTRYVSVQLGIGGFKPFAASYVHERGYGDCKALSNYMIGLLRSVGVPAFPVLIRRGFYRRPMIPEFPSNQFNHVIVCVPSLTDTLWLECTSQINPMGMIGPDNERRSALLFSEAGGKVVSTPVSPSVVNVQSRLAEVTIRESGSASLAVTARFTGNQQDDIRSAASGLSPLKKQEWVQQTFGITDARIQSFTVEGVVEKNREVTVAMEGNMPTYVSRTSKRSFIPLNPFTRRTSTPRELKKRLTPIMYNYAYLDIDTVTVRLPEGFDVETVPENVDTHASFGSYSSTISRVEPHVVRVIRKLEIREPIIPADHYDEYRAFFATVAKADKSQIVLVKP